MNMHIYMYMYIYVYGYLHTCIHVHVYVTGSGKIQPFEKFSIESNASTKFFFLSIANTNGCVTKRYSSLLVQLEMLILSKLVAQALKMLNITKSLF